MSEQRVTPPVGSDAVAATADVIHDIGFRHYAGVRLGRGWIVRSLLIDTLRGIFGLGRPARAKVRPWLLAGILLLPALVVALVAGLSRSTSLPMSYTAYLINLQIVIGLFVAQAAPYAVSRDLRYGVMPLYLSRPMARTDYVAARFGGLAIALFLVTAGPQTVLFLGALLAGLPVGAQVTGWAGGLAAAVFLAVLLAVIGLLIAAFTPRRGLGIAAIITTLLVLAGVSNVLFDVAQGRGDGALASLSSAIDPGRLVDGLASWALGVDAANPGSAPTSGGQAAVFVLVYFVFVGACGAALVRRYRKAGRI